MDKNDFWDEKNRTRVFGADEFGFKGQERLESEALISDPIAEDAATLDPAELARRFDALGADFRRSHETPQQQQPAPRPQQPASDDLEAEFHRMHGATKQEDNISLSSQSKPAQQSQSSQQPKSLRQARADDLEAEFRRMHGTFKQETQDTPKPQPPPLRSTVKSAQIQSPEKQVVENDMEERAERRRMERDKRKQERQSGKGDNMTRNTQTSGKNDRNGKNRKKKKKESLAAKIVKWAVSVIVIMIIAVAVIGSVYVYGIVKDMPRYDTMDLEASLKVMSTMYDDQGQPMKNIYLPEGQRTLATYKQLPNNLKNAIIAIEDKTFMTHKGFNIIRIGGAILESWRSGGSISGTSTITQQLARNIWLIDEKSERTAERKIKEAFYARELEKNLSKEEILLAYLNTIALGNHSYGILAAAENYYGKRLEDLDLVECAALAALPKAPSEYMMIITVAPGDVEPDDSRILLAGSQYTYLYNDSIEPRLKLVLNEMYAQGYITKEEYEAALKVDIRSRLHPKELEADSNADFFVSYAIDRIADDLLKNDPLLLSRDAAIQKIYSGGLDIYTTFNQRAQDIATEEFSNPENFPKTLLSDVDKQGNILNESRTTIMLFNYDYMFETRDDGPWFHLIGGGETPDYVWREDGSMLIYSGASKRLGVYRTNGAGGPDINLEFKDYYVMHDNVMYIAKGGYISIPVEYKGADETGNLILSKKFFDSPDNIFTTDENDEIWIGPKHFTLRQEVLQPQAAFTLIDHTNGQLKAMIGGRDIKGQFQFNRALSPRPPGSTIKPIGVYAPAIEMSANGELVGSDIPTYGPYWSTVSIIIDEEMEYQGRKWPKNWYTGFRGPLTMRNSIEQSVNINAVKVLLAIGEQRSITFLKKLGITTLVEEGGTNDLAPGALALGGMTKGLTPLEIASAYGTFANAGVRVAPITYTLVKDKRGNILLDGVPEKTQVMDSGTAFIMNDMLRTTVSNGIATAARVNGTQVAGKTGTTSDYLDAWFVGNTPKYTASVWIGCDIQVRLSQGSAAASKLFSTIMTRVIEGEDQGEYPPQPSNVEQATVSTKEMKNPQNNKSFTDYFITGTIPEKIELGVEELDICLESYYLATPWCPHHDLLVYSTLNASSSDEGIAPEAPTYYCYLHNLDPGKFPPNPAEKFNKNFGKAKVPTLFGLTFDEAIDALEAVKLVMGTRYVDDNYSSTPADIVLSQNPSPGELIPEGSMVNVMVSRGPNPAHHPPPITVAPGDVITPLRLNPALFYMKLYSALLSRVAS